MEWRQTYLQSIFLKLQLTTKQPRWLKTLQLGGQTYILSLALTVPLKDEVIIKIGINVLWINLSSSQPFVSSLCV